MAKTLQKVAGAEGATVAYRQYGQGPRLITVLHSLALDGSWYEPLAEALGEDCRLLAPGFRGPGDSARGERAPGRGGGAREGGAGWVVFTVRHEDADEAERRLKG